MLFYTAEAWLEKNRNVNSSLWQNGSSLLRVYCLFQTVHDKFVHRLSCFFNLPNDFSLRLSVKRTLCIKNDAISHPYSIGGLKRAIKSNVSHVVFHSIRHTLAHTNDIEINWCNDKNSCLATVRGENPPLQFQALHLAWHVMWSQLSLKKTNHLHTSIRAYRHL